ncbi:MAG: hypothetical protein P8O72_03055 [Flavobacteriaceae bacterium]|nr:hypothetical protein [Flavobacteriaceae bacterium]
MKHIHSSIKFFYILFIFNTTALLSQIKMGDNPLIIDPAAILEIESKEQGVLLPRMSSLERDQISFTEIPNGLLIFNTDFDTFEFYSSLQQKWIPISSQLPQLSLVDNRLSISPENKIDLGLYLDNTDEQKISLEGSILKLEAGGSVDLSPLLNKNNAQQIHLNGTQLFLENGGSVDLNPLLSINTYRQQLSLVNSTLMLERGGSVNLSNLNQNTDEQTIDQFQLVSNTLFLSLENDGQMPLKLTLPETNTDNQRISLSSSTLMLERGGTIDLASFKDNTDEQLLNLTQVNSHTLALEISNGNTVRWTTSGSLVFSLTASNVIQVETKKSPFSKHAGVISNRDGDWINENFVFGSDRLENDPSTTNDNKRFLFSKTSGAFRAGVAQSDQWDSSNLGTYSVAMGRNTIASGYNASAFGISTKATAWYTTTFGQGTEANSRTETVIGSYNSRVPSLGGTRDWNPLDRLFVIGNGTGSATASRTNALVMLKNGTTHVSGIWTGPGFTVISDRKIKTYQYELKTIPSKKRFGFMADEIEKVFPELVTTFNDKEKLKSIDYVGLIPVLVNALVQQQKEIDQLKKRFEKR